MNPKKEFKKQRKNQKSHTLRLGVYVVKYSLIYFIIIHPPK